MTDLPTTATAPESCANCRFSLSIGGRSAICRRYPPVVTQQVTSERAASYDGLLNVWSEEFNCFPKVLPEHWCGEWRSSTPAELPRQIPSLGAEKIEQLRRAGFFV